MSDMSDINDIKKHVHTLEIVNRTSVWEYLITEFEKDPKRSDVATLCLHQMMMYLYELEGDPRWSKRERENEYDDYYKFGQSILHGYDSDYRNSVQFQWELCYYLKCIPIFHFLLGDIIHEEDTEQIRESIIKRFLCIYPNNMLFKYIDPIQSFTVNLIDIIPLDDIKKLFEEVKEWNLQENYADQELKDFFNDLFTTNS